ncbi:hypothetical protein RHGRI_035689 [Rhododendron griersonianum]|uniref:Uncharacterized protein n=1 Tax=Rhododendron griersonianum TaxID=479676 RepID=A0AAV6HKH7_9ERIC|nr:hypothetical protein RHGRI_035689 [Rhododendron griersonianum]
MPPRRQRNVQDLTLCDQIAELRQSNQALQQMMNELLQQIPVTNQSTVQSEGSGRTIFDNEEEDDHSTSSTNTIAEPAFINPWSMDQLARVLECSDRSIQVHVPDFEGKLNADEYCDWTAALEAFFDWKDLSDERKVQFVATKLKGHALIWWQQYQRSRVRKGVPKVSTWTEMKLKLDEQFLPLDYAQNLYQKLHQLNQQSDQSVADYTEQFYQFLSRLNLCESDEQLVARYVSGLKSELKGELIMLSLSSLEEAYQMALKAEKKLKWDSYKKPESSKGKKDMVEKVGAQTSERPNPQKGEDKDRGKGVPKSECFRCGEAGHRSYECPKKKAELNLVNEEEQEPTYDEEVFEKKKPSSSSPIPLQRNYDVFLSFRGIDTRPNFTSHLFAALEQHGFHTFHDTKLNRGEDVGWCLDELVKIMECRKKLQQIVFPIFYNVDPSDVRAQKGSLAEAFAKHVKRFKEGPGGKVEKWKEALTQLANLSGWDLPKVDNGDEAKLIKKIVEEVRNKLDVAHPDVVNHQVGLESRLQKLNVILSMESSDVRIVGIWGICGIGKTTIAKSLYSRIQRKFEHSSFLANIRETTKQPNGLVVLQEKLLSDIFKSGTQNIKNVDQGIEVIKQRAFCGKVLLVLDDVDDVDQLKALAICRDVFVHGSRIIITTRDSIPEWKRAIPELKQILLAGIYGRLKISLNTLNDEIKELFLDLACFFSGTDQDFTIKILEGCNICAAVGIQVLADQCLIKYGPRNELVMDDMLIDMGREIVRQQSVKDPGKRSRLWYHEDALEVLKDGTGTEVVEGLVLTFPKPSDVLVNAKAFKKMNRLWLLHLNHVHLRNFFMENLVALDLRYSSLKQVWDGSHGTKILPKLKFLYLSHCYYLTKTPDFSGLDNLEELLLNDCVRLVDVDESIICLDKLVVLDLKNCEKLRRIPLRVWIMKSLRCLDISGCCKLVQFAAFERLPDSIGLPLASVQGLSCLKKLSMGTCHLSHLPFEIGSLISLEVLHLYGKSPLTLPSSICNITRLKLLDLSNCNFSHLPGDIGRLISLETLNLGGNDLLGLPGSICNLTRLKSLDLKDCKVSYLPGDIGGLVSLETLNVQGNRLVELPGSVCDLTRLKSLDLKDCNVSYLPGDIGGLISLEILNLGGNDLLALPGSICHLTRLKSLDLKDCKVSYLPGDIGGLVSLETLNVRGNRLVELPGSICDLTRLKSLDLKDCNVSYLPGDIGGLISLETLNLGGNDLLALPGSICHLTRLKSLDLKDCKVSYLPGDIGGLVSLETLNVIGNRLVELPGSICDLTRMNVIGFERL